MHVDTAGMACKATVRMARGWNGCADWLHNGRRPMVGKKKIFALFLKMYVFYFVGYHKRHNRGCLRGGPAVARLGPLLFLTGCSGGFLRCLIQGDLGLGSLALRERIASCRAWAPSISPILRRSGLRGGCRWFSCLLSRRRSGATGSRERAGAFREEMSHRLRRLLSLREAFSKAIHSWSKQAAWGDQSTEEGNFVHLFNLRHREPEVVLQHYQSGHQTPDGLGGSFLWRVEPGLSRSSGPWEASSLASILAWKTWSKAIEWSAEAACPATE